MKNFSKNSSFIKITAAIICFFIAANSFGQQAPTINLTTQIATSSLPVAPTTVEWYTDSLLTLPVTSLTAAPVGLYYAVYNYGTCKSKPSQLRFITNICPDTTVNLFLYIDSTKKPVGSIVTFHSGTPATLANRIPNTQALTANSKDTVYYYSYYDATASCFSSTAKIVVKRTFCISIVPHSDAGTIPATGGIAIPNIANNDSVNGAHATLGVGGNATVSPTGASWPTGITLNATTGAINVASGTAPGVYTVNYSLCDTFTPTPHCSTTTAIVTVTPVINPVPETGTVSASGGTAIINVTSNDSINGNHSVLGSGGNATISTSGTWPTGITLNTSTGAISVAAGTPPGSYPVVYNLCDTFTPTPHCQMVNDVVVVSPSIIPPADYGTIPSTGGIAVPNVASNDTVNGQPATLGTGGNATIAPNLPWPTGITLNTTSGAITVAPGTPPGTYTVSYTLCDKLPIPTCQNVNDVIIVTAVIDPTSETGTVSTISGGIAINNIATNDSINGVLAILGSSGNSTISTVGTWPAGITLNTTNGNVNVPTGTTPGTYLIPYQICDKSTPTPYCQTIQDTVIVTPVITPTTDAGSVPASGGTAIANIVSNDNVNGQPATLGSSGNSTIAPSGTTWPAGITLNTNTGTVNVATGTPPGTYSLSYQLCDKLTPQNCSTSTIQVVVNPPVLLPDVNAGLINQPISGSVATNDVVPTGTTYGTPVAVPGNPNPSTAVPTMNPNGTYTFTPTAAGVYTFNVPVCPAGQSTGCPTVPLVITVTNPASTANVPIASPDLATMTVGTLNVTVPITANDLPVNPGNTLGTPTLVGTNGGASHGTAVISGGQLVYTPTPGFVGTDTVRYQVCETPSNICTTSISIITVLPTTANITVASDDMATTSGTTPATGSVLSNDNNSNGHALTVATQGSAASPIVIPGQGSYYINSNGTYSFTPLPGFTGTVNIPYTVCDGSTPPACATASLHVVVNPIVVLNPDVNAGIIGQPIPGNVSTNDVVPTGTTYGTPVVVPGNPNPSTDVPTMNANGSYTFTPTAAGVYTFNVPVCPSGQSTGCPTVPLVITVTDPASTSNVPIASPDLATMTVGTLNVTVPITANDLPVNPGNTLGTPTLVGTNGGASHGTAVISGGQLVYTPTPGFVGTDTVRYQVCETPSNICTTSISIITVLPTTANNTVASDDIATTSGTTPATGSVLSNDNNSNGHALTVATQGSAANPIVISQGSYYINSDGTYSFTPASGFTGTVNIPYTVCDATVTPPVCATATLHIVVISTTNLPIQLISFKGIANGCSAFLTWSSANEINFNKFELQKSADAITFNSITSQLGKGFASDYNYLDASATINGKVFYRLKMLDNDGKVKYSPVININITCKDEMTTVIYPNPTFDVLNIKCSATIQKIELFNDEGQLMLTQSLNTNQNKIVVLKYPAGIYFLKVSTASQVKSYKIKIK